MNTPEIRHHRVKVNGIQMHFAEAGSGPPVLLLHGYPETWFAWRKQIPVLSEHYHVIAPDLRGYGDTEKPFHGYDKRTMARDIRALMVHLGIDKAPIIGHDRGARVATRFAKDHRDAIERLAVLDNVPTRVIHDSLNAELARKHWFFIFQHVPDLPEALIAGREEVYFRHFYTTWCYNPQALSEAEIQEYVRAFSKPGAVRGAFCDYRALEEDVAQDRADEHELIDCPTLALWGSEFEAGGKAFDILAIWRKMARQVEGKAIPQCGHLPHEECPKVVNAELLRFLRQP